MTTHRMFASPAIASSSCCNPSSIRFGQCVELFGSIERQRRNAVTIFPDQNPVGSHAALEDCVHLYVPYD